MLIDNILVEYFFLQFVKQIVNNVIFSPAIFKRLHSLNSPIDTGEQRAIIRLIQCLSNRYHGNRVDNFLFLT